MSQPHFRCVPCTCTDLCTGAKPVAVTSISYLPNDPRTGHVALQEKVVMTGLVTATVATTGVPETEETVISTATGSTQGGVTHGSSLQPMHASPASKRYRIPTEP